MSKRQLRQSPSFRQLAARVRPTHPGYYEGMLVSGARILTGGAVLTAVAIAVGGSHLAIGAVAALPFLTRLSHLLAPALVGRHGSARVAAVAAWMDRCGFLLAALAAIVRPPGFTLAGFLAGIAIACLGQNLYDASMAALHSEATGSDTFGRYTAEKARWAAIAGLAFGVLASMLVDLTERLGVPPNIARGLSIVTGVLVHGLVSFVLPRMRIIAQTLRRESDSRENDARAIALPDPAGDSERWGVVRFALGWGFAFGISVRQSEAMAISLLGVSVGGVMMLNAVLVGAGILGAKTWGRLADRFGGKGLMSIALLVLALDPLWMIAAMLVHPVLLVPSYALWGVFASGWAIAQNTALVRTDGAPAERIRALMAYNVAFGLAAGIAPLVGGALLELLDGRVTAHVAYVTLFALAAALRLSTYPLLRRMPAPDSERGRRIGAVVLRAVRSRAARRTRALGRLGRVLGESDSERALAGK